MAQFGFHHIHLRSPDPEATAKFYEKMFGAELIRSTVQGKPRLDMKVGGVSFYILPTEAGASAPAPSSPYLGLDHIGFGVTGIDAIVKDLKAKGASFTMEPNDIRPGVRIAFLRGPENVSIELVDTSAA